MPVAYSYTRYSTAAQSMGASLARQVGKARAWAAQHGYDLDDSHADLGVSAYSGAHRTGGALGRFHAEILALRIPVGSALLIEAVDRLSREDLSMQLELLTSIVNRGCKIVTLNDNVEISRESLQNEPSQIYQLIGMVKQANQYSKALSERVLDGKARARDKNLSDKTPVTRMCPAWLTVEKTATGTQYALIPERVAILRQMFADLSNDVSKSMICRRLNEQGIMPFDRAGQGMTVSKERGNGWHLSYIVKLVQNRSLIGEFQPTEKNTDNGKRKRVKGSPVPNYYPSIIDAALFERVNAMRHPAGRKGKRYGNILQGVAKCWHCGSTLTYINKGDRWKNTVQHRKEVRRNQYMVCNAAARRITDDGKPVCEHRSPISYHDVEAMTLAMAFSVADAREFSAGSQQASMIEASISENAAKIVKMSKNIRSWMDTNADDPNEEVMEFIRAKTADKQALMKEAAKLARDHAKEKSGNLDQEHSELRTLWGSLTSIKGEVAIYDARARIHGILTRCIDVVMVDTTTKNITSWAGGGRFLNIAVEGSHSLYCIDGGRTTKITNGKGNAHYHTPPDLLAESEAYRRGDVPLMTGIFQGDHVIHFEPLIDGGFERVSSPVADIAPDLSTMQAARHTNLDHVAALDTMPGAAAKRARIEATVAVRVAEFRAGQAEAAE